MLQDELLAMSEKLIVTLEDLVARLMPPTTPWNYGRPYKCYDDLPNDDDIITDGSAELCKAFESNNLMRINFDDVEKEKKECGCLNSNMSHDRKKDNADKHIHGGVLQLSLIHISEPTRRA